MESPEIHALTPEQNPSRIGRIFDRLLGREPDPNPLVIREIGGEALQGRVVHTYTSEEDGREYEIFMVRDGGAVNPRSNLDLVPDSVKKQVEPEEHRNRGYSWYSGRLMGDPATKDSKNEIIMKRHCIPKPVSNEE